MVQNKRAPLSQEATNKIFELLFALVLLDVSERVILDDPFAADGDNPDALAEIDGKCWRFACKTVYGASGKTFYDNLQKDAEQIEAAARAQIGIVVINFRNIIRHEECWPILNETEYRNGAEPIFAAYVEPGHFVAARIEEATQRKLNQVCEEVGFDNVMELFAGKKALPAFLAFCQSSTGRASANGPVPTLITKLNVGVFGNIEAHRTVFDRINSALHERGSNL